MTTGRARERAVFLNDSQLSTKHNMCMAELPCITANGIQKMHEREYDYSTREKKSRFRSADGGTGGGRVCVWGGGETEKDKNTPACLL